MAGDLNFKVGFETEQAASAFRQLFQEYINGSAKAGDEANKLLGGTIKKNVEVRLEVDKQSGTRELTTVINRARTELDQYERQFKRATRVEPGSITSIRQALREAKQARDAVRQFADYAADASGKIAFRGPESERYIKAQKNVKDLENQMRSLEAASGSAFDRIRIGLNLDSLFKAGQQLNDIVSVFQSLEIAINAITAPIKAVTKALGDLQSFALSFKAIGAGAAGAGAALSESSRIALGLGVNIKTVREGMQQLSPVILNAGGGLDDVSSIMEALSSRFAAFGLNADKSRRVMNGVIQAFSKGKLMAEELTQQISEADPAFKSDLAKALKVSTSELEKMVKAGEVTSDVLIKILPSLSKSSLLFGKLGDSATSAVDALDSGNAILTQVENNIASIGQLNLEAFADIAKPIVSSFLRAQAVVIDFVGRISKLESVKAIVNIFSAVAREAVRVVDVFLRLAEGFLIVLSPIAKLVNLLLEIPLVAPVIGLTILANLVKPLQVLSKSVSENIIQQSGFANQIKAIWSDIGKPFDGLINRIRGVNREIAASVSGKRIDLFKDGQRGAAETSSAIRDISQSSKGVSLAIQKDFERAFSSAKTEVGEIKNELNQLRKSAETGSFVPVGTGSQRTLAELRVEADSLRNSLGQIGPTAQKGTGEISKFAKELSTFGRVTDPVAFDNFKKSIATLRVSDPVKSLGLLQAALRQMRAEAASLPAESGFTRFVNTKQANELKRIITEVAQDFRDAGTKIPSSANRIDGAVNQINDSFNKLNADRLLVVQSQIAEAESQIAGSALRLNSSLTQAQGRMDAAGDAAQQLGSSIKGGAVPALGAFSREAQLLAQKRDIETRLRGIREEFTDTVRAINRDARTVGKAKLPGSGLSGANAEAALAAVAARGNAEAVDREQKLKAAIEARRKAQAALVPSLRGINDELTNMKLNNDAVALFPKNLSEIGVSAKKSTGGLSLLSAITGAAGGAMKVASKAVFGFAGAVRGLLSALGPIGIALIGIQVLTAAWANGTKGQTKGLEEGQVAVDAYASALKELDSISLDKQTSEVSVLQEAWNSFSIFFVDIVRDVENGISTLINKINSLKPPKWVEELAVTLRQSGLFDKESFATGETAKQTKTNTYAVRQFTDELNAYTKKSKEATDQSDELVQAIISLGPAASRDEASKQKQINAYVQLNNIIEQQRLKLAEYESQLNELLAIEESGGKLTLEQVTKKKALAAMYQIVSENINQQGDALQRLLDLFGYLKTAISSSENSLAGLSDKLQKTQEKFNSLEIGSDAWLAAAAEVVAYESELDQIKKALSDPIWKKNILDLGVSATSNEIITLEGKILSLQEQLDKGLIDIEDIAKTENEIKTTQAEIDKLRTKLEKMKAQKIVIDAEVEFKINQAGFNAEIADVRSKLAATQFVAKINGVVSPELKSAAGAVATAFQGATDATRKFEEARRAYSYAVTTNDFLGQVAAAQNIAKEGENYKLAIAEARVSLQDTLTSLKQGLIDAVNELRNLKLNNLNLLPVEQQQQAIRELNAEVQRIAESRGLKVTFRGTADGILQAKQQFVDFYNQLDKGENKVEDIRAAIDLINQAITNLGTLNLGKDGDLFKKSIEGAGAAALIAEPYIKEIQNSLDNGKLAAEGISSSLLSLDGKTIKVNVVTTGVPGLWTGGPASAGTTYRVNELGKEGFLSNSGRLTDINRPRNALWRPPTSGTVIPAHIMRSIDVPKAGISVKGSRVSKIAGSMHSANGSNALIRELRKITQNDSSGSLKHEIATTHAAQTMEIGRLTRAVRELVDKDWNVNVKVRNNGGTAYMNALNRLS